MGLIAAVLFPSIFKSVEMEKRSVGKENLSAMKERIVAYAKLSDGKYLPPTNATLFNAQDVWGNDYVYIPADGLLTNDICDSDNQDEADLSVITVAGDEVNSTAFVLAAIGKNGVQDAVYADPPTTLTTDFSNAEDDILEFMTYYELYRRVCAAQAAQGGGGGIPNPPGGQVAGFSSFFNPVGFTTSVNVETTIVVAEDGSSMSMGEDINHGTGCVWSHDDVEDVCEAGNCTFGEGSRTFFAFQFETFDTTDDGTDDVGDGFTFAIISAESNNRSSCGGSPDDSAGSFIGYAGEGVDTAQDGIVFPKLALEFDTYRNDNYDPCTQHDRGDGAEDHLSLLFWGNQTLAGCPGSFDDNLHAAGAGNNTDPYNGGSSPSESADGSDGYFYSTTMGDTGDDSWLEKYVSTWYVRIEVHRNKTDTNADGNHGYALKAWLRDADPGDDFKDMSEDYTTEDPDVVLASHISPSLNDQFDQVLFGFTQGTGSAIQTISLEEFRHSFRQ